MADFRRFAEANVKRNRMKWKLFRQHLITLHATFDYTRQNKKQTEFRDTSKDELDHFFPIGVAVKLVGNGGEVVVVRSGEGCKQSWVNNKVLVGQVNPGTQ